MTARRALPGSLVGVAFTTRQARAEGVTRGRTGASDLAAPFHGVRAPAPADGFEARVRALATLMGPELTFSHGTAAELLGLPLPSRSRGEDLHVTTIGGGRAMRRPGVVGHRAASRQTVVVRGVRVTAPIDTWLDLAASLPVDELVAAGDALVRRQDPMATMEQLGSAVAAFSGRGARGLRRALELVRPRSDSPKETELRLMVVRAGLPEPVPNLPIRNEYGLLVAYADLAWPDARVLLEYEGAHHATDPRQFARDIERINELQALGWFVIRVDRASIRARATLLARIGRALGRSR